MRKFFLLTHPVEGNGCYAETHFDLGEFKSTLLWKCQRVPENYLDEARFRITPGDPWDFIRRGNLRFIVV